jgi:branched-chain amino acid transport system permease protein
MSGVLGINEPLLAGIAISIVAALSFYLVFAAGQFNVAQPGFMAIGAYAVGLTVTSGHPALVGALIGVVVSAVVAAALTALTVRLSGVYLAMATLAFVEMVEQTINITPALRGSMGIYGIPLALNAFECWLVAALVALVIHRLMDTRLGYEMRILREDPVVARGIGVDDTRVKMTTGILSAVVAAIAGGMKALTTSYISSGEFTFGLLILILSFAIVGGTERYWGTIIGAVILTALPEYTRELQQYRMILSGLIILGVVVLFPEGIAGALVRLGEHLRRERRPGPPAAVDIPPLPAVDSQPEVVLDAVDIAKRFGGVHAVDGVRLQLHAGLVHGLIGPNGAGKSTLVDLLSGEQRADDGRVFLRGQDVTHLNAYRRSWRGIARTFQTTRLTQNMTVREIAYSGCLMSERPGTLGKLVGLPRVERRYREARLRADAVLKRVDLAADANRYVRNVGWEEQRRLEIARALVLRPSVLLLDEPTAGMHAESLPEFGQLVREIASTGTAVLLIEHNVAFIRSTVDVLHAMDLGRMVAQGQPGAVLSNPVVVDSYLGARVG